MNFIKGESPIGTDLYTRAVPWENKIIFLPGSARQVAIYDTDSNTYKAFDVSTDTHTEWSNAAKFADCVEYNGILYLFGERYSHVLRLNPENGEIKRFDTEKENTVWMRHAAFKEGGLVRLVSATSNEYLTFNLRTEKLFVQNSYSKNKVGPKLKECADEKARHSLKGVELSLKGDMTGYTEAVFENFDCGKGMILQEVDQWISFEEVVKYVQWRKTL